VVTLTGGSGNDALTGKANNDLLDGMDGNDTLNGGAGADTMIGGAGNDVYIVDNVGDVVVEDDSIAASGGIDTIRTTLSSYSLATIANVENLSYIGTGNATLSGNSLDNVITGGSGNDTLTAGAGIDTLHGGAGNDTLVISGSVNGGIFDGGTGIDTLAVSNSTLTPQGTGFIYFTSLIPATLNSIEKIELDSTAGPNDFEVFVSTSQIGAGISSNATLVGGAGVDEFFVVALTGGEYYLPSFNLSNWNTTADPLTSDVVILNGANGHDYILHATPTHSGYQFLLGADGNDHLIGGAGNELMGGNDGNDTIDPGDGNDTMIGGAGNDIFVVDGHGQKTITDFTIGQDQIDLTQTGIDNFADLAPFLSYSNGNAVLTSISNGIATTYTLQNIAPNSLSASDFLFDGSTTPETVTGTAGADILTGAGGGDHISGGSGNDTLFGLNGNDTLDGGPGNDVMYGGNGNDTYIVDSASDVVNESPGGGNDTVQSSTLTTLNLASYANVENLTYTGSSAATLTGDANDNVLTGGSGNDTLIGGGGIDTLHGGGGNDRLVQSGPVNPGQLFDGGAGIDTLAVSNSTLGDTPSGPAYQTALFQAGLNSIEQVEFDSTAGPNPFEILVGVNQIGAGISPSATLIGGAGRDGFVVVAPTGGEYFLPSFSLSNWTTTADPMTSDLVVLTAVDQSPEQDYILHAAQNHAGYQVLVGQGGNDQLIGGAGNELLSGGAGNDTIKPGDGTDTMTGGAGNDVFVIDGNGTKLITDFTVGQDKIDLHDSGIATFADLQPFLSQVGGNATISAVISGVATTYTLQGVSLASLTPNEFIYSPLSVPVAHNGTSASENINGGSANDIIYGNGGNDTLSGFAGNDTLDGGPGNDRMVGGTGNDVYIVDSGGDTVIEYPNEGIDTIKTSLTSYSLANMPNVENLTYTGSSNATLAGNGANNYLQGGNGNDRITGGAGDDTIAGGGGKDTLSGGAGADVFVFDTAPNSTTNVDMINDFTHAVDKIRLSNAIFSSLSPGTVTSAEFISGAGAHVGTMGQYLAYDTTTATLYYDADSAGPGQQVAIAKFTAGTQLTFDDIIVYGLS
jgi:Ca2+-binding RTX toxin-like protein